MSKLKCGSIDPTFITPQIRACWVSPTKLEISVGRAYYIVVESDSEIFVGNRWEHRDGPSEMTKRQYEQMHGKNAAQIYEEETGIPWDKDRGFLEPVRIQLEGEHSIILPAGFEIRHKVRADQLKVGDLLYILLEGEDKKANYRVESVYILKQKTE